MCTYEYDMLISQNRPHKDRVLWKSCVDIPDVAYITGQWGITTIFISLFGCKPRGTFLAKVLGRYFYKFRFICCSWFCDFLFPRVGVPVQEPTRRPLNIGCLGMGTVQLPAWRKVAIKLLECRTPPSSGLYLLLSLSRCCRLRVNFGLHQTLWGVRGARGSAFGWRGDSSLTFIFPSHLQIL